VDRDVDQDLAALQRELARARAERRWLDADSIAQDIAAHRREQEKAAKVIPITDAAKAKAGRQ
jgi:hypothetical protein